MKNVIRIILMTMAFVASISIFTACSDGSFTDPRDGQKYKTIKIGDQIWMNENLRFKTKYSVCYLNDESQCSKGRYYSFLEAIAACPNGWHLPTKSEAAELMNNINGNIFPFMSSFVSTRGVYDYNTLKFDKLHGDFLWVSPYGFFMRKFDFMHSPGIDKYVGEEWQCAIRCIADSKN